MIHLIVKDRDKTVFEGDVDNVTSYNKTGIFDVLQDHSNFITVIEKKLLIKQRGATKEIEVSNGLFKVLGNKIWVYLGVK